MSKKQWDFKYLEDYVGEGLASKLSSHINEGWVIEHIGTVVVNEETESIHHDTKYDYIKQVILLKREIKSHNADQTAKRILRKLGSVQDDSESTETITHEEFLERLGEDDPEAFDEDENPLAELYQGIEDEEDYPNDDEIMAYLEDLEDEWLQEVTQPDPLCIYCNDARAENDGICHACRELDEYLQDEHEKSNN